MTNKEISSQSSNGGKARAAKLTAEERKEIAQKAAQTRWQEIKSNFPKATHLGKLIIADKEISCAVLDTGKRVITQSDLLNAIGRHALPPGNNKTSLEGMPSFLASDSLKLFITDELRDKTNPIAFKSTSNRITYGYDAMLLPLVCEVYLKAREKKSLKPHQQHVAEACEILIRGFARVGLIALIDEATGYQELRARTELHQILAAYISTELLRWTKRFPDEFFKEIFRLHGWQYKPESTARPQYIGHFIKQYVYNQLPPGVIEKLEELNPQYDHNHYRKHKHHQWLTVDTGNDNLNKQLLAVTTIMKVSDSKEDFERNFAKWHKKEYQERLPLTVDIEPAK